MFFNLIINRKVLIEEIYKKLLPDRYEATVRLGLFANLHNSRLFLSDKLAWTQCYLDTHITLSK